MKKMKCKEIIVIFWKIKDTKNKALHNLGRRYALGEIIIIFVNLPKIHSFVLSITMDSVAVYFLAFKLIHIALLTGTAYRYNRGNGWKEWFETFSKLSYLTLKDQ